MSFEIVVSEMLICGVLFKLNLNKTCYYRAVTCVIYFIKGQGTKRMKTIADLKIGERAFVKSFQKVDLSLKLLEMGCLPGVEVMLDFVAPFGDPLGIQVNGYCLAMRKEEAATVLVEESI